MSSTASVHHQISIRPDWCSHMVAICDHPSVHRKDASFPLSNDLHLARPPLHSKPTENRVTTVCLRHVISAFKASFKASRMSQRSFTVLANGIWVSNSGRGLAIPVWRGDTIGDLAFCHAGCLSYAILFLLRSGEMS